MDPTKNIATFSFPFPELILEEIFLIPSDPALGGEKPETIYDLARLSARTVEQVWHRLRQVEVLSKGALLTDEAVLCRELAENPVLFDVRWHAAFEQDPVDGALHLPTLTTDEYLSHLAKHNQVCLCISEDGRKAFSSAMWFREQGVKKAFATALPLLRSAYKNIGALVVLLILSHLFMSAGTSYGADAEVQQMRREGTTPEEPVSFQIFVQRPSIKLLFSIDEDLDMKSDQEQFDGMEYQAESLNAFGAKVSFNEVALMLSRRISSGDQLTTRVFEDYQLSQYVGNFGFNIRYQNYKGMVQLMRFKKAFHTDNDNPTDNQDRSELIKRPDSSVNHRSVTMQYLAWPRHFSLSRAFGDGSDMAEKGYGFPFFIAASRTEFDAGDTFVDKSYALYYHDSADLMHVTAKNIYLGGGAAMTFPFGKFFATGDASAGFGLQDRTSYHREQGKKHVYDAAYKGDVRVILGWNIPHAFSTISYELEGTTFRVGATKATVQSDVVSAAAGVRF